MPAAKAAAINSGTRTIPSSSEYSVCNRRWTNEVMTLGALGEAHRLEGAAMQRTGAMKYKPPLVILGRIAFVTCERILRIDRIHMIHITIPGRFRQNGGGADGRLCGVAADDGTRRQALPQPVYIGQLVAVDQQMIGDQAHRQQRAPHRKQRGLQN